MYKIYTRKRAGYDTIMKLYTHTAKNGEFLY